MYCECVCPSSEPCSSGKQRCQETCQCGCINGEPKNGCSSPLTWNDNECKCVCPAGKQMPAGGCGNGKSYVNDFVINLFHSF